MPNKLIDSTGSVLEPKSVKAVDSAGGVVEFSGVKIVDSTGSVTTVWTPTTVVEGFEDGDHVNWDRWEASWAVDSTEGLDGTTYAAYSPDGSGGDHIRRHGDVGFGRGTKFRIFFKFYLGGRVIHFFNVSTNTADDHYEIWCFKPESSFELVIDSSGSGNTSLTSTAVTWKDAQTYYVDVDNDTAGDGTLAATLYEGTPGSSTKIANLSVVDTTHSGDGIGAYAYSSSGQVVDQFTKL